MSGRCKKKTIIISTCFMKSGILKKCSHLACVNTSIQLDIRMIQITKTESLDGGVVPIWVIFNSPTGCKLGDV